MAAREASAGGASTLILEKGERVGEPVRCGEFLPSRAEIRRICDSAPPLDDIFDLPRDVIGTFIERARAYAPSGKAYEVDFEGYSIWRDRLDKHLAKRATNEGALLWTETPFQGANDGIMVTPRGPLRARVVIGADGPLSSVARAWGFPRNRLLFPALSLPVEGSFEPVFEAFFGSVAPGGYAWVIPRQKDANVGLGVRPGLRQEPLQVSLHRFLASRGLEADRGPIGGYVPMSGPLPQTVRGNVLLAGDAAGQVLPTSGGGIFTSMICGYWAGRTAIRYLRGKGSLQDYEGCWRESLGGALERGKRLFEFMAPAFDKPDTLEEVFRLLGPQGLAATLRCQDLALIPERPRPR